MSHLSREIVTLRPRYSMQIFPKFVLAILTRVEQIFPTIRQMSIWQSLLHWDIRWCHIYRDKSSHWCLYIQCKFFPISRYQYWRQFNIYCHFSRTILLRMVRQRSVRNNFRHWDIRWCHIYREKSSHWGLHILCKFFRILRLQYWRQLNWYFEYYRTVW